MDPKDQSKNPEASPIKDGEESPPHPAPLTDSLVGALLGVGHVQPKIGTWQPPSPEELQGQFPQYEIRGVLGRGGMGAVYKGWQTSLRRLVAIKILPSDIEDDGMEYAERFKQEARAMAQFKHPGIVAVYDAGETREGLLYFVMECVEGKDVAQIVTERGRLPPAEALSITIRVCEAMAYAHERGVIHRDIKPSNVLIESDGRVKVSDFGLAKLSSAERSVNTANSLQIGSIDFMPPEALCGSENVDHRGDIYAVGGLLYQMLTGRAPHGRFVPPSFAVPGLDKRFDAIVDKAMRADAAQRYPSAKEMQAELERIAAALPAPAAGGTRDALRPGLRHPGRPWLVALLIVAIIWSAVLAFGPWRKNRARTPADGNEAKAPPAIIRRDWKPAPSKLNALMYRDSIHLQRFDTWRGPDLQKKNVAVRSIIAWQPSLPGRNDLIKVTARWTDTSHYYAWLSGPVVELGCYRAPDVIPLQRYAVDPPPGPDEAVSLQLACVGQRLMVWVRDRLVGVLDDDTLVQEGKIGAQAVDGHFRSLEYLDLDGLPDASAFQQLGLDASGSSALAAGQPDSQKSGKAPSPGGESPPERTARWHDAFAESPLREVIASAEHTAQGYRLPKGSHWTISPKPLRSGALRVRASCTGEKFVSLYVIHDNLQLERVRFRDQNSEWMLSQRGSSTRETDLGSRLASSPLDEMPHELLLARIGGRLRVVVDGKSLLNEPDPSSTTGRFVLDVFPDAKISAEKVEYLDLDDVPEAEALKQVGIVPEGKDLPRTRADASPAAAKATKDAPFANSLGMKFVPVPITGGPTGGQRVLFSVWETRVRDYEAFTNETKRTWAKPPFPQDAAHPAVGVNGEDAQAFCTWLTKRERASGGIGAKESYRLPTDHEWSCAAGIGEREDPAKAPFLKAQAVADLYPWGSIWPPPPNAGNYSGEEVLGHEMKKDQTCLAGYRDAFIHTSPVGSFAANRFGLFDLGGNAWELCEDLWKNGESLGVIRGASFGSANRLGLLSCYRDSLAPDIRTSSVGFRVVLSATPSRRADEESAPR